MLSLFIIHARWIESRVEVRGRGILFHGALVPWLRMVNYEWLEHDQQNTFLLHLNVRRPFPFLASYYRICVPSADVESVDRCLRNNLSVVPDSSRAHEQS
jgi:hypothetical protein